LAIFQLAGNAQIRDLIDGHDRKTAMNARKKNSQRPLDNISEKQPLDRIAELEHKVADLQKDVAMLKQVSSWPVFADQGDKLIEDKKPGPKEKISNETLLHYRDALVLWLEPVWPWLEGRLSRDREQLRAVLEAVAEQPDRRSEWQQRLLQNTGALTEFLRDKRFRKTLPKATVIDALNLPLEDMKRKRAANQFPSRQIANAMAGVPDIAWRTSLDRCSAQPSVAFVAVNMDMFYRDLYGIPILESRDLTGLSSPLPKPVEPALDRSSHPSNNKLVENPSTLSKPEK
jgi:hypothetical protein